MAQPQITGSVVDAEYDEIIEDVLKKPKFQKQLIETVNETCERLFQKYLGNPVPNLDETYPCFLPTQENLKPANENSKTVSKTRLPDTYDGESSPRRLLLQLEIRTRQHPELYSQDSDKIDLFASCLSGRAFDWFYLMKEKGLVGYDNYSALIRQFTRQFDRPGRKEIESYTLLNIRQRPKEEILDYVARFRASAQETDWNDASLRSAFINGLQSEVLNIFTGFEFQGNNIDETIEISVVAATRARQRELYLGGYNARESRQTAVRPRVIRVKDSKDTEHESTSFTPHRHIDTNERERRRKEKLCMYCGSPNHLVLNCPSRPSRISSIQPTDSENFSTQQ